MKKGCLLCLLLALLFTMPLALADKAQDITSACTFTVNGKHPKVKDLRDNNYMTYYSAPKGSEMVIENGGEPLGSLLFKYNSGTCACTVDAQVNGEWQRVAELGEFLTQYVTLPEGTTAARVNNVGKGRANWTELTVFGPGEEPDSMPHWVKAEKADLMLVAAHPDDELLWFAGLLPTYAGERGLTVQVVTLVPSTPNRRLELLDGLAVCGVTAYPLFANQRDHFSASLRGQYKAWNKDGVYTKVTGFIRQVKPDVIVTHDIRGEYGHGAHMAAADAVMHCYAYAADPKKYPASAEQYGTWQPHKVYLHLYTENQLTMDWHQPLENYSGEDSYSVACRALACHRSQTVRGWEMEDPGEKDNRLFGLYYTDVGPDVLGNDLMENIPAAE